jgi:hypothetical protein
MDRGGERLLSKLYFGCDAGRFYLRLDGRKSLRAEMPSGASLRVTFAGTTTFAVVVTAITATMPKTEIERSGVHTPCAGADAALDQIFELAMPFQTLGLTVGMTVEFYVELCVEERVLERAPAAGAIRFDAPSPDFERILWQV